MKELVGPKHVMIQSQNCTWGCTKTYPKETLHNHHGNTFCTCDCSLHFLTRESILKVYTSMAKQFISPSIDY